MTIEPGLGRLRGQRGTVMLTVIVVTQIVLLIGVAFLHLVRAEYSIAIRQERAVAALAAAEAGVEDGIQRLRYPDIRGHGVSDWGSELDDDWNTTVEYQTSGMNNRFSIMHALADAACDRVTSECTVGTDPLGNPFYLITSEGQSGQVRRTVQVVLRLATDRLSFADGVCSLGDLAITFDGELAAYDSQDTAWSAEGRFDPRRTRNIMLLAHRNLTVEGTLVRGSAIAGHTVIIRAQARVLQAVSSGLDFDLEEESRVAEEACSGSGSGCAGATVRRDVTIGQDARVAGEVRYGGAWIADTSGWSIGGRAHVAPPPAVPHLPQCAAAHLRIPDEPPPFGTHYVRSHHNLSDGYHAFETIELGDDAVLTIRGQVRLHARRIVVGARARVEFDDTSVRRATLHVYLDCRSTESAAPCGLRSRSGSRWNSDASDPARLLVFAAGMPAQTERPVITIDGATFAGAIYAPDAGVEIGEGTTFFGALAARQVVIFEPKVFALDRALHRLGVRPHIGDASVVQWRTLPQ